MGLRKRSYTIELGEATASGMVPAIIKPLGVIRRAQPSSLLMKLVPKRKRKKRWVKRFSKQFSPPLPPRV